MAERWNDAHIERELAALCATFALRDANERLRVVFQRFSDVQASERWALGDNLRGLIGETLPLLSFNLSELGKQSESSDAMSRQRQVSETFHALDQMLRQIRDLAPNAIHMIRDDEEQCL